MNATCRPSMICQPVGSSLSSRGLGRVGILRHGGQDIGFFNECAQMIAKHIP